MDDAVQTVMSQCEMWTDNEPMDENSAADATAESVSKAQKADIIMLPLVGEIAAGHEHFMEEDIEEMIPTERSRLTTDPDRYFYLRVSGDSMIGAGIHDGDKVLIRKSSKPKTGDIVAAIVSGDTATLKTLHIFDDHVELRPENPDYEPYVIDRVEFDNGQARMIGVLVKTVR